MMRVIQTSLYKKSAKNIPPSLQGLAAEARKYPTFEEFEKAYLGQIKHGTYWHLTDNPNFQIDPLKGPRDMSSMSNGKVTPGKLMITSHIRYWNAGYNQSGYGIARPYAAQIDMSQVDSKDYYQVNRGMGNEFMVTNPTKARVIRVIPIQNAIKIDSYIHNLLPDSTENLKAFYDLANPKNENPEIID